MMRQYLYIGLMFAWTLLAQANPFPTAEWPTTISPMQRGWDMERLESLSHLADEYGTSALLIIDSGDIMYQYGTIDKNFPIYEINHAILNVMLGSAYQNKGFKLNARIRDFSIEDRPPLTVEEGQATVLNLLQSRSGIAPVRSEGQPKEKHIRHGYTWQYNPWGFRALEYIYQQAMNESLERGFQARIAQPLQLQDYKGLRNTQQNYDQSTLLPMTDFSMSARDLARVAYLYLMEGQWASEQLIPSAWVKESTSPITKRVRTPYEHEEAGAFGLLWWVENYGEHFPGATVPAGTYSARGKDGQFLVIIPSHRWIIVHLTDEGMNHKPVSENEFGEMLALILKASTPI